MIESRNQIHVSEYVIQKDKYIGVGKQGIIFGATKVGLPQQICCRITQIQSNDDQQMSDVYRLMGVLSCIKQACNPHIVQIYDYSQNGNEFYTFMEQCSGNSLAKEVERRQKINTRYSIREIKQFLRDMVSAYKTFHNNKLMHRDIRPSNIMIDNNRNKLKGFKSVRVVQNINTTQIISQGELNYYSPQLITQQQYTCKCDIYSIGVILYQMTYMELPYDCSPMEFRNSIDRIRLSPIQCPDIDILASPYDKQQLMNLMNDMLRYEESDRISWEQLFNHNILVENPSQINGGRVQMIRIVENNASTTVPLFDQQVLKTENSAITQTPSNGLLNTQITLTGKLPLTLRSNSVPSEIVYPKSRRLLHLMHIMLAKSKICTELLECLRHNSLNTLNQYHLELLRTCVLGYQNKILSSAYGISINNRKYISHQIISLFDPIGDCLFELQNRFQIDIPNIASLFQQSNHQFKSQEYQLKQLMENHLFSNDYGNFLDLLELQIRIEYAMYTRWFKYFYLIHFKEIKLANICSNLRYLIINQITSSLLIIY